MILIFGGTTEGRLAAQVCDQAGKLFYYSTLSDSQVIPLRHGVRLVEAMTADEMLLFCQKEKIHCIVDASHPFAVELHKNIAKTGIHVIRLMRHNVKEKTTSSLINMCYDYDELLAKLKENPPKRLLALSGVNTIPKLKEYWQTHETFFRILSRIESIECATDNGFPMDNLIFYTESNVLPTKEQEQVLMKEIDCDAIVTKESGITGGYAAKVQAALELGLRVFVIKAPDYSDSFFNKERLQVVTGCHGLRRAIEKTIPEFFPLHTGFTSGTIATAAVKAAAMALIKNKIQDVVEILLPNSETISINVEDVRVINVDGRHYAEATVLKDFSDDPDVTRGCRITARVEVTSDSNGGIRFLRGEGVGRVTLPGLGIPVGDAAINRIPRQMMTAEVRKLTDKSVDITISVENGQEIAKRTFNERVGVIDGISIIGSTGIVFPFSNDAFIESVSRELEVAKAIGCDVIGLASGKQGEEALISGNPSLRVVHYGNVIGDTLSRAYEIGFRHVILGIMIGKAVKLAEGNLNTHSHKVSMNKPFLIDVANSVGVVNAKETIERITLARELWELMPPEFFENLQMLCLKHCRTVFPSGVLDIRIIKNR